MTMIRYYKNGCIMYKPVGKSELWACRFNLSKSDKVIDLIKD